MYGLRLASSGAFVSALKITKVNNPPKKNIALISGIPINQDSPTVEGITIVKISK